MNYPTEVSAPTSLFARTRQALAGGWSVVIGAALCMSVSAGLSVWALGIFVQPLETEFGWTRAETSLATSITFLIGGITGPIVGLVIDRWGARIPIMLGALSLGLTYIVGAQMANLWQFYLLYAVMAFARAWVNYIPFLWLVARWFPDRMGAPLGVMGLGFSAAGLLFVPLVTWMVGAYGWRDSFIYSGLLVVGITVPAALFLLKDPPNRNVLAVGMRHSPHLAAADAPAITLKQALRMPAFWLLAAALSMFFGGLVSFTFHAIPFYLSRGFSDGEAAGWVGAVAAAGTASRIILGMVVDRVRNLKPFAMIAGIAPAAALLLLAYTTEPWAMVAFVIIWSIGTAIGPLMESVLLVRTFGTASFGAILGALGVAETVGTIIGPYVGGAVYDATGDYQGAFLFYAVGFTVTAIAFGLGRYKEA